MGTAVQRWDGQAWRSLGTPAPPSDAYSVAVDSAGTVYAGGPFGVARLAGGAWQIIGSRASNEWPAGVYTLAVAPGGDVYAGGRFSSLGGTAAANVARWDGAAWHALGTGTDAPVRALAVDPARGVYVGGEFGTAGGTPAAHIALWDGATWRTLGDGLDGDVFALTRAGASVLYAGGRFGRAGAVPSPYVARWTAGAVAADAPPDEPSALRLDVSPSPARGTATARIRHPAGPVTVDLFDARGRHVAAALAGDGQAGEQAVPLRLGGLAPGVYVVRLVAGGSVRTRPLVVVR